MSQPPQRGDPHISEDVATNQLVAKVSRLYAKAAPEDQFALRAWMRDIILGRKVRTGNMVNARRVEKRMVEACERRILEFPLEMDAREVARALKLEGWYACPVGASSLLPDHLTGRLRGTSCGERARSTKFARKGVFPALALLLVGAVHSAADRERT